MEQKNQRNKGQNKEQRNTRKEIKQVHFQAGRDFDFDENISVKTTRTAPNNEANQSKKSPTTDDTTVDMRGKSPTRSILRKKGDGASVTSEPTMETKMIEIESKVQKEQPPI